MTFGEAVVFFFLEILGQASAASEHGGDFLFFFFLPFDISSFQRGQPASPEAFFPSFPRSFGDGFPGPFPSAGGDRRLSIDILSLQILR